MTTERAMRGAEVINDSMFSDTADEERMAVIIDRETSLPALEAVAEAAKEWAEARYSNEIDIAGQKIRAALARLEKGSPDEK